MHIVTEDSISWSTSKIDMPIVLHQICQTRGLWNINKQLGFSISSTVLCVSAHYHSNWWIFSNVVYHSIYRNIIFPWKPGKRNSI